MWGKRFVLPVTSVILFGASMNHVGRSVFQAVSSDPRVLYVWAEYKMLTGEKDEAVQLFQRSFVQRKIREVSNLAGPRSTSEQHVARCEESDRSDVTIF